MGSSQTKKTTHVSDKPCTWNQLPNLGNEMDSDEIDEIYRGQLVLQIELPEIWKSDYSEDAQDYKHYRSSSRPETVRIHFLPDQDEHGNWGCEMKESYSTNLPKRLRGQDWDRVSLPSSKTLSIKCHGPKTYRFIGTLDKGKQTWTMIEILSTATEHPLYGKLKGVDPKTFKIKATLTAYTKQDMSADVEQCYEDCVEGSATPDSFDKGLREFIHKSISKLPEDVRKHSLPDAAEIIQRCRKYKAHIKKNLHSKKKLQALFNNIIAIECPDV